MLRSPNRNSGYAGGAVEGPKVGIESRRRRDGPNWLSGSSSVSNTAVSTSGTGSRKGLLGVLATISGVCWCLRISAMSLMLREA